MSVVEIPDLVRASIAGRSDRGNVREENPGLAHHASTKFGDLLVVADAVGDAAGGSQASRMAVEIISSRLAGMLALFPPEIAMEEAVRQANMELTAASTPPKNPSNGGGVAVVVAMLRMDTDRALVTIGHVGDSRAYLASKHKLTLLTGEPPAEPDMLERKFATAHHEEPHLDQRTLTPHLGGGLDIKVATSEMQLAAGDTLLLCSGGLWRSVSEQEIERVLANQTQSVEEACRALLDLARDAGGHDNVAIEIARLTQSGDLPETDSRADQNQPGLLPKVAVTPEIEWRAPQPICYGTPLSNTQLNATASVPGTFVYNPGLGAILSTGEHTLSVVFTPSNQSEYAPAQATVPLSVAKANPSIRWPAPDPINNATPLGSAQLNASASVPGSFAYSPAAGELPGAGAHTLLVNFTPADPVNYAPVQARVSLMVIEPKPAAITWQNPHSISYGTVLGDKQLSARSSVPGSFRYVPAPGNVLPPGRHELSAIFTPEDKVKYSETRAAVTLIVEELPIVAPARREALPTPLAFGDAAEPAAEGTTEPNELFGLFAHSREVGDAAIEPPLMPKLRHDAEWSRSEPLAEETVQEEMPLFRAFQSDFEADGEPKRASKWLTIASVVIAIPMLCVLVFLVVKAHSGAPFIAHQTDQPVATAGDSQPQSNSQDPAHQAKVTIDQAATGNGVQPASSGDSGNNQQATKPAQTESTYDQPAAPRATPQNSRKRATENLPVPASSHRADANEASGSKSDLNPDTQVPVREPASSPVAVSASDAAGRLMESRTPIYPPAARASGISGTVELGATISKDGTVKDLRIVSGPLQLREAAVNSVRTWRYRPFMLNNEPTEVQTTINVVFSLR
jgi:TonB family protein